jgi:lysine/ornithine N-monooxygenase
VSTDTDVAVIGAGPYGLAAAAHLRRAGIATRVHGEPMGFWRGMPAGMLLRSNWSASNIAERDGELSLDAYMADTGARLEAPVPLARFVEYGEWVQRRAVPDLDRRLVRRVEARGSGFALELEDGEAVTARRVIVACGIERFQWLPRAFADLPGDLVSHTGDHADLSGFAGRRVAVVGGGQSALGHAALLHEAGAEVEVLARGRRVIWLRGTTVHKRLGNLAHVVYAPTDVGPLWYSRLCAAPEVFRRLPRPAQDRIAARSIRAAGSHWVRVALEGVPIRLRTEVVAAHPHGDGLDIQFGDGSNRHVDHLMFGTGYRVDVSRYPFLPPDLLDRVRRAGGYPVLTSGLESSVTRLHFVGAPAAWSFGPLARFVSGTWYTSRAITEHVRAGRRPVGRGRAARRRTEGWPGLGPPDVAPERS